MISAGVKVFAVAVALGLDVFAVGVGVGVRGASRMEKIRIGAVFAASEVLMNLIGAGLGAALGRVLGDVAGYAGFAALVAVGTYMISESRREAATRRPLDLFRGWGLPVAALSISVDSLGVGFSILYLGAPVAVTLVVIAVVNVASTTAGLSLGRLIGRRIEESAEFAGGVLLVLTGVGFMALKAFGAG
jgi:putative Mn2+ efflux pump MntP